HPVQLCQRQIVILLIGGMRRQLHGGIGGIRRTGVLVLQRLQFGARRFIKALCVDTLHQAVVQFCRGIRLLVDMRLPPIPAHHHGQPQADARGQRQAIGLEPLDQTCEIIILFKCIGHLFPYPCCVQAPAGAPSSRAATRCDSRVSSTCSCFPCPAMGLICMTPAAASSSPNTSASAAPLRSARLNCALKLPPPALTCNRSPGTPSRSASASAGTCCGAWSPA